MRVEAKPYWTDTGVEVAAGETLRFRAAGRWVDWVVDCGPEGYERPWMGLAARWRRIRHGRWFALSGALDRSDAEAFVIGAQSERTFERAGRLFVFANDVPGFYWNNKGAVELEIERA